LAVSEQAVVVWTVCATLSGILGVLKLAGAISWPWWAILSPVWVPAAILMLLVVALFIGLALGPSKLS